MTDSWLQQVFCFRDDSTTEEERKEDAKNREFLISKGMELSEDMENEPAYVSLLFMMCIWYDCDGYGIEEFLSEEFVKGIHQYHTQADKKFYAVTLELKNGYDLSFDALEDKTYILRVYVHGGADVTDAPAIRKILDEDDYCVPDRISELPSDAHLMSWFEVNLDSDYEKGLEAYGLETYEEVRERMLEERALLKKKYSS